MIPLLSNVVQDGPSVWGAIARFLFGSFIGWWILVIFILLASRPLVRRFQTWQRYRRFLHAEGRKLANEQDAVTRFGLAKIYYEGGRYAKAERYIEEAIRIADESPLYDEVPARFHLCRAHIRFRRKRTAEAEESYRRSLKGGQDLDLGDVYLGLGRCALRMGRPEEAAESFRRSLEERTSTLETYFRLAQAEAMLGRPEGVHRAKEDFARTAAALPKFARRGRLRWRLRFLLFPILRHLI